MSFFDWDFSPPKSEPLGDRDVSFSGNHLKGKKIALIVSGGIAAMKSPLIARALRKEGAEVTAFLSEEGKRYVGPDALAWSTKKDIITSLTHSAEHLSDDVRFDAYLVAPATYNIINKMAHGIADTPSSTVLASALGRMEKKETKIIVCPTMHGSMHNSVLIESCKKLKSLGVQFMAPRDDYGKHNIPEEEVIVTYLCRSLSQSSLKNKNILVTGGPTPVAIDGIRRLTNHFTGALGGIIARELTLRGADAFLINGAGKYTPPYWIPHKTIKTFEEYRDLIDKCLLEKNFTAGIFSSSVADYAPVDLKEGKMPSGKKKLLLELKPTEKIIEKVRKSHKDLLMVTFKYEENISKEDLLKKAGNRLKDYPLIIANRKEDFINGEQVAWIMTSKQEPKRVQGKEEIAKAIIDSLELLVEKR